MKQFSMFCLALCAALPFILSSCGSDESTTTENTSADSMQMDSGTMETASTPASYDVNPPYNMMVVTHKVADFDKWKASYDQHDSVRTAFGVHSYVIARMVNDPDKVLVAVKADDADRAMAFSTDPSLKAAMKDGGVTGTPDMRLYKVVYDATNDIPIDTRVLRNITVKDWDAWKAAFESSRQLRLENGIEDRSYGYDVNDNHKVMVVLALTDSAKADAFLKSAEMKKNMKDAGVVGKPEVSTIKLVARY